MRNPKNRCRGLLGIVAVVFTASGCTDNGTSAPAAKAMSEKDIEAVVARRVKEELAKRDAEQRRTEKVAAAVPKPKVYTFEEAWEEARSISKRLDEQEPKKTQETISHLGTSEQGMATLYVNDVGRRLLLMEDKEEDLFNKYGLSDLLARKRRERAFGDSLYGIEALCRTLWQDGTSPGEYVRAAELWGSLGSQATADARRAVDLRIYPESTGAVRVVESIPGGKAWLDARRK